MLHHVERRDDEHGVQLHGGGVDERGEAVGLFGVRWGCGGVGGLVCGDWKGRE